MKKIIILLLFINISLFGSDASAALRLEIIKSIVLGIDNYQSMPLYSDDKELMSFLSNEKKINIAKNCKNSKLVILSNIDHLPKNYKNKYIFVLDYDLLYEIPESFGAFYWKKGRPNIIFIRPRLLKSSLNLIDDLKPYIEDKVW